jgi:Fic family protein
VIRHEVRFLAIGWGICRSELDFDPRSGESSTAMDWTQMNAKRAELDSLRPMRASLIDRLREAWDVEMIYESNRIEGNSLTLRETELVLSRGITIAGKPLKDHLEAINLQRAWQQACEWVRITEPPTERQCLILHEMVMTRIDDEFAGRYRADAVRIAGAKHVPPNAARVPEKMAALFADVAAAWKTDAPVEVASRLHYGIASIHPFRDGNGRTARLAMNVCLMKHGYPPIVLSADDRTRYYQALDAADAGDMDSFTSFIGEAVLAMIERYLAAAREGQ